MWTLAQQLPLEQVSEIAKQLNEFQSIVFLAVLALVIVGSLIFSQSRNQIETNKSIREMSASIRDISKSIENNTSKHNEVIKMILDSNRDGDRFSNERFTLLEQDFRSLSNNYNELVLLLRSARDKDDTIGRKLDALADVITKPISNELLTQLDAKENANG